METGLNTNEKITWCPGCGNFTIWGAMKEAVLSLGIPRENVVITYGIGCHGKMVDFLNINGFEGLHGRALPLACGIKLANEDLKVIAVCGDGDCYSEGLAHLLHSCRLNYDITCLVHNNMVFALTTGQASPTSQKGLKTKTTPRGSFEERFNPLEMAVTAGASFVGRAFAGNIPSLRDLIVKAVKHKGFSLLDILQPCITFNKINTYEWYRERIYNLDEKYNPRDKKTALEKTKEWDEKIPVGVIFQNERPTINEFYPKISPSIAPKATENLEELLREYKI